MNETTRGILICVGFVISLCIVEYCMGKLIDNLYHKGKDIVDDIKTIRILKKEIKERRKSK